MSEEAERDEVFAAESDHLHALVGRVLRLGMATSVAFLLSGLAIHVASGRDDAPSVRLWEVARGGTDAGLTLMTIGVLVLALTPALRVLTLVVLWWRERDWRFVAVALAVVTTLTVGVFLGRGG